MAASMICSRNMKEPSNSTILPIDQSQTTYDLKQAAEHFSSNLNDAGLFLVAARQSLEEGQSRTLLEFLQRPEYQSLLNFVGWDLVKIVFEFLPDENTESECRKILVLICNTCNPREICLSLDELLLSFDISWLKLVILIGLFQLACQRLNGKVVRILSSILASLTRCLTTRENNFDHLFEILEKIMEFLKPYVEKIQSSSDQLVGRPVCEDIKDLQEHLELFLVGLLEFPLVSVDVSASDVPKIAQDSSGKFVSFRKIAENIVEYLGCIECNSFKHLFEYDVNLKTRTKRHPSLVDADINSDEESKSLSYLGIGCLAFLVVVEEIGSSFLPIVVTGRYFLKITMAYITPMLSTGQTKVTSKGLKLLLAILGMIESATLHHGLLEGNGLLSLAGSLTRLMTHCEDSDIRRDAVLGLRGILDRLYRRGKYALLRLLNQSCTHSGLAELLILILKEEIVKSLQDDVIVDQWFIGTNAADFLKEIFYIPSKVLQAEDGIVEERNRILCSLNLFRFLLIRDHANKTRIHTIAPEVESSYLKPLTDAVSLSKRRLETYIKDKRDEIKGERPAEPSQVDDEIFSATTPKGCELGKLSLQDQLQSLEFTSLTIDMIDSVLARIREIREEKGKERTNLESPSTTK